LKLLQPMLHAVTKMWGEYYVVDNLRGLDSAVVVRYGYGLYYGRSDPYSACNSRYCGAGAHYSRQEGSLKSRSHSHREEWEVIVGISRENLENQMVE
jgi:hypothetical protein